MPKLNEGERVVVQNERNKSWEPGTVVQKHSMPRSYVVEGDNDGIYRRNRYHLKQKSHLDRFRMTFRTTNNTNRLTIETITRVTCKSNKNMPAISLQMMEFHQVSDFDLKSRNQ